jgi:uncharacterized small protein (DUF1192 family)
MNYTVEPELAASNGHAGGPVLVRDDDRQRIALLRRELDEYYQQILGFHMAEPDQVLLAVSGISARLIGIRAEIMRGGTQRANKFRTSELDPLLDHLEQQFRIHSRLLSVRDLDFRMSGGQV